MPQQPVPGAGLLLTGQVVEFSEALLAREHGVQGNRRGHQNQQRGDGANGDDHLLHIQAHDGHHQHRHQHTARQGRHAELLLEQGATTSQHDHGDGKHEKVISQSTNNPR